jgi:hypothetical protein
MPSRPQREHSRHGEWLIWATELALMTHPGHAQLGIIAAHLLPEPHFIQGNFLI